MRIVYLTDLHIGATPEGFHQQARKIDVQPELFAAIARLHDQEPIDLLILGGDQTEHGSAAEIEACLSLVETVGVRTLICLGNHDLVEPDALERWQAALAGRDRILLADRVVSLRGVDVIGINTWWQGESGAELRWDSSRAPAGRWPPEQLDWLRGQLAQSETPAILVMHAPMDPAPTTLTGLPQPIHGEAPDYVTPIEELLLEYPRVRLVMAGHSHITSAVRHPRYTHLTTSSAIEAPFQCRLLEMEGLTLTISAPPLLPPIPGMVLDSSKRWAAGNAEDQEITLDFAEPAPERERAVTLALFGWSLLGIAVAAIVWLLSRLEGMASGIAYVTVSAIALVSAPVGAQLLRRSGYYARAARGRCPACSFDLSRTPTRCPECGLARMDWRRPSPRLWYRRMVVTFAAGILVAVLGMASITLWASDDIRRGGLATAIGMLVLGLAVATLAALMRPRGKSRQGG